MVGLHLLQRGHDDAWGKPDAEMTTWELKVNVNMWQRTQASQGQTNSLLTGNILSEGDWQPNGIISLLVFLLSSIYATFTLTLSPLPSSSRSALIQLCICILNDSITRDPAVKITDVFHYFSPLGHRDPNLHGSNNSHPPFSLHPFLSTCLIFFLSHCRTPPPDKHSFAFLRLRGNNS